MSALGEILVIGAGAAGATTAETLRRQGYEGRLTLVGGERHLPYDRPPLSKQVLSGQWEPDRIQLRRPENYDRLGIELCLGTAAVRLDRQDRAVELADGTRRRADAVVIATGVRPRRLPGGTGLTGVHVLRTVDDALALRDALAGGPRLVVAGAGLLGTEAAIAARGLGAEVTLLTAEPVPLLGVLGPQAAGLVVAVHRELGLRVRHGRAAGLEGVGGAVTGVRLTDGSLLPADVVLVAVGSRPSTEWLAGSGIGIGLDDGVVCDAMGSAGPGVWAAGDLAAWPDERTGLRQRLEHRTRAGEQAVAVARNLLAGSGARPFASVPYFWTDQQDLRIQVYGEAGRADRTHVVEGSPADRAFTALYCVGGRVRGALAVNMPRGLHELRPLVENRIAWTPAQAADVVS